MSFRIRVHITERTDLLFSPATKRLAFVAIADDTIPVEDRLTQGGAGGLTFTASCDNPVALEQMVLGAEFYFDVSPVPE